MVSTARRLEITEEDLASTGPIDGGLYSDVETPGDYAARLVSSEDYYKDGEDECKSWKLVYEIIVVSGPVTFPTWLAFSKSARWKIIQVAEAHGHPMEAGIVTFNPGDFLDTEIGVTIDFPRDSDGNPTSKYREIVDFYPLVEGPEDVAAPTADPGPEEPEVL